LIINGEIYRGCGRGAAEIGHLQVKMIIALGSRSSAYEEKEPKIVEHFASGWGIAKFTRECLLAEKPVNSILFEMVHDKNSPLTVQDVVKAVERGDAFAESIFMQSLGILADGICHMIALLSPRRIVIGGGVSLIGENLFFAPLRRLVAER